MFNGFSDKTIDFLWGIRFNNEKGWFEAHKEEYKRVLEGPMKALAAEVLQSLTKSTRSSALAAMCPASTGMQEGFSAGGRTRTASGFHSREGTTGSKSPLSGSR